METMKLIGSGEVLSVLDLLTQPAPSLAHPIQDFIACVQRSQASPDQVRHHDLAD
jgi:hypothetical protein